MTKKIITVLLVCTLLLIPAACNSSPSTQSPATATPTATPAATPTAAPETAPAETVEPTEPASEPEVSEPETTEEAEEDDSSLAGDFDEAFEAYNAVMQNLSTEPGSDASFDIDFTMDMILEYAGEAMPLSMGGNMKVIVEGENVQCSMIMDMSEYGAGLMEIYTDGESIYCAIDGIEQEIDMSLITDQLENSVNMPEFEKNAIKYAETTPEGDSSRIDIIIDGEALSSFVMESMSEMLSEADLTAEMSVDDIYMSILTDANELPETMDMEMSMSMVVEGEQLDMTIVYSYIFNQIGDGVVIDFSKLEA